MRTEKYDNFFPFPHSWVEVGPIYEIENRAWFRFSIKPKAKTSLEEKRAKIEILKS